MNSGFGWLHCDDVAVMAWQDGERELWWSRAPALDHGLEQEHWATAVTSADTLSDLEPPQVPWLIAKGPESTGRALLGSPPQTLLLRHRQRLDMGRVAAARFELDALPFLLAEAGQNPDRLGLLLSPFRGPEPAALVAGWLRHLGSARLWARLWLCRHAESAARALIPAAAGKAGKARQNAADGLRFLSAAGHGPIVAKTSAGYGPEARTLVEALLTGVPGGSVRSRRALPGMTDDELSERAAWRPSRKSKLALERLPEIRALAGGVVPEELLLGELMAARLDDPPEPAPGDPAGAVPLVVESSAAAQPTVRAPGPELAALIAGADRGDLAAFGRALLDAWLDAGMPPAESWALLAQAHLGDDATMDVLAPQVRSWPARSRHARAVDGFAVLATVGTDAALRHLLAIETNMVGGPTNERCLVYLAQAAAVRGLSVTQLADRLTITHGLDAGVVVDYGPRSFPVIADEHLVAQVVNAAGRVLARPPKPGVKDTRPAAYPEFLQFKKDLRATATAQAVRLEKDMLDRRVRPARDVAGVLLPHPVLGRIARRLLWGEFDGRRLVRALRIAEDGSLADRHDDVAQVDPGAAMGIVHPADLGGELGAWAQIFADYEIVAPFPQLGRAHVTVPGDAAVLPGFGPLDADQLLGLMRNGWHGNGYHIRSGIHDRIGHRLPGGLFLLAELSPGMPTSAYQATGAHRITEIWVDVDGSDHWRPDRHTRIGDVDPIGLSEALVELYGARG
ncbi:MAG TPA: DUF4132 domain-containing protein [Actinoplanes sp.]|nr:DUF4132 domain-containing protein [Actinoplanes sp.]